MMRVSCLWGIQVESAPWVVEHTGLDLEVGLQTHREWGKLWSWSL